MRAVDTNISRYQVDSVFSRTTARENPTAPRSPGREYSTAAINNKLDGVDLLTSIGHDKLFRDADVVDSSLVDHPGEESGTNKPVDETRDDSRQDEARVPVMFLLDQDNTKEEEYDAITSGREGLCSILDGVITLLTHVAKSIPYN